MARAQQALERNAPRASGAGARNAEGTRNAQAQALQRSGRSSKRIAGADKTKEGPGSEWASGAPMGVTKVADGHGGMGYGPTAGGGKALQRTGERADPGKLVRDTLGAMQAPKVVRSTGNIWDDPHYGAMANEHGAEFAMRARNLDQKINSASQYRQMLDEGREARYAEEARRRDDERDKAAFQQEMAAAGTPQQIEQAFGPGAKRNEDGSVSRPGGAYDATDETGAFTGARSGAQEEQLLPSQVPPTDREAAASEQSFELTKEKLKSVGQLLEGLQGIDQYDLKDSQRKQLNQQIQDLNQVYQQLMGGGEQPQAGGGMTDTSSNTIKDPNTGKEYKVGDKLPSGRIFDGYTEDGQVKVK